MKKFSLFIKMSSILLIAAILIVIYVVYDIGDRIERELYGVKEGVVLENQDLSKYLSREVEDYLLEKAEGERVIPQNAYINRETGEIIPEVIGREIDVSNTLNRIMAAEENSRVSPIIVELYPEVTEELLMSLTEVKGSYFTWHGSGYSRVTNIKMGTTYINNTLLHPGQVFSFNQTVGPVTSERGFKFAPVISGGTMIMGLGGGLCQVSSTLYNAVLEAGYQVVERYPHSKPVGYVPRGRDATISYHLDFKFRNNTDSFVLVKGSIWGGRVQVDLLSSP